jgi:hypothetical protein
MGQVSACFERVGAKDLPAVCPERLRLMIRVLVSGIAMDAWLSV